VILSSVVWREAWKYGERAFRYCQHDVGHALGALRFSAATLGWQVRISPGWTDAQLARHLGLDRAEDYTGAEPEIPEVLVRVDAGKELGDAGLPAEVQASEWQGRANRLSPAQVRWPAIDAAVLAAKRVEPCQVASAPAIHYAWGIPNPPRCARTAEALIRQRRSAVAFDGITCVSRELLLAMLDTTQPRRSAPPFDLWPWRPQLHLVLFVHRVVDLQSGLYAWLRDPEDARPLRAACREEFEWAPMSESTGPTALYRLALGDVRDFARAVSCGQDIAADGAFSLGMLARVAPVLQERGAAAYRELFWEAGMIGQSLYLAAEAAGVRGTGIGCFFDDVVHQALGLKGHEWQSLYHFTVGGPVEDPRLRTLSPYAHMRTRVTRSPIDRE
jgi:nitroreductase